MVVRGLSLIELKKSLIQGSDYIVLLNIINLNILLNTGIGTTLFAGSNH